MQVLQKELSAFSSVSPIQPDKALLACEDEDQARTLANIQGWYKVGKYQVRFLPWSAENMLGQPKVPSYGGWIKVKNLPLDKWSLDTFKFIGNECGGYIETASKTLPRMDMMEIGIKVQENGTGFIPAEISIPSMSCWPITVKIDPLLVEDHNIGYKASIH